MRESSGAHFQLVCREITMQFALRTVFLLLALIVCVSLAFPTPDSAGIVERVNGLAYGGIPYGSVSGALSQYRPFQRGPNAAGSRVLRPRNGLVKSVLF